MPERDGYIPGVPCWVDASQPDPEAAVAFYGGLFGWDFADAGGGYLIARLRGGDVAAVTRPAAGAPAVARWNTYVRVDSADDAAARAREAGGTVLGEPFDVEDAGRMAVLADPEGAVFCVWEPRAFPGARIVNEHGAVNFNGLHVRDTERAVSFYGAVFGWRTLSLGGEATMWTLPGYGDHLEAHSPGLRARIAELGAPAGFEDVVASLSPIPAGQADAVAHWDVTFGVHDADATAARAEQLGGTVAVPPFDAPWVRAAVIADPQGATFIASQFVPENRDAAPERDATAGRGA